MRTSLPQAHAPQYGVPMAAAHAFQTLRSVSITSVCCEASPVKTPRLTGQSEASLP